jgi:gas vesicle protein
MGHKKATQSRAGDRLKHFLGGACLGAAIALLFAPNSGDVPRAQIDETSRIAMHYAREHGERIGTRAGELYSQTSRKAADLVDKASRRARELFDSNEQTATQSPATW